MPQRGGDQTSVGRGRADAGDPLRPNRQKGRAYSGSEGLSVGRHSGRFRWIAVQQVWLGARFFENALFAFRIGVLYFS